LIPPLATAVTHQAGLKLALIINFEASVTCKFRVPDDDDAIEGALGKAWQQLLEASGRMTARSSCSWGRERVSRQLAQ